MKTRRVPFLAVLALAALFISSTAGCAGSPVTPSEAGSTGEVSSVGTVSSEESSLAGAINPLTGLSGLSKDAVANRPVAVMVNNLKAAWSVQTGLNKADIVYETYVEGGITRLLAVYKNPADAPDIGTVRSLRYSYVDLAMGHDAILVHAGMDPNYCTKYIQQVKPNNLDINSTYSSAGFRENNGKALEHTLYTSGSKLVKAFPGSLRTTLKQTSKTMFSFRSETTPETPAENACASITMPFSSDYTSAFKYDAQKHVYLKSQGGNPHKDLRTGTQLSFKNVFVLYAKVTMFDDNYHVKTDLSSGTGVYVSEGGSQTVKWSKGSAADPLKVTMPDGTELKVNAGNSWICFVDINQKSAVTVQ